MAEKDKKYFCDDSLKDKALLDNLTEKVKNYYETIEQQDILKLYRRAHRQYNDGYMNCGNIDSHGPKGKFKSLSINDFSNIINNILVLTTKNKPTMRIVSSDKNASRKIINQVDMGLTHYENKLDIHKVMTRAYLNYLLYGTGYAYVKWNKISGDDLDVKQKKVILTGDLEVKDLTPMDVIHDITLKNIADNRWYIVREQMNRYELAAMYPNKKKQIISGSNQKLEEREIFNSFYTNSKFMDDKIYCYTLYHIPTYLMNLGRKVVFIEEEILADTEYNCDMFPCVRIYNNFINGCVVGACSTWDILPIQSAKDKLSSSILTNQVNYGINAIAAPSGSQLSGKQLGALKMVEFKPSNTPGVDSMPKPIKLLETAQEIFAYEQTLTGYIEKVSGISPALRGQAETSNPSGRAIFLLQGTSLEHINVYSQGYIRAYQLLGQAIIEVLSKNSPEQQGGKGIDISFVQDDGEPKKERIDFSQIKANDLKFRVELPPDLLRSTQGKIGVIEFLQQNGYKFDPSEIFYLLETGKLKETVVSNDELDIINEEHNNMLKGIPVTVNPWDRHDLHIPRTVNKMRTKEVRDSGKLELFMAHLNQHIQVWSTLDPTLLKAYGIPPYLAAEMDTEGNAPASDSSPGISELLGSNLKSEQPKK